MCNPHIHNKFFLLIGLVLTLILIFLVQDKEKVFLYYQVLTNYPFRIPEETADILPLINPMNLILVHLEKVCILFLFY